MFYAYKIWFQFAKLNYANFFVSSMKVILIFLFSIFIIPVFAASDSTDLESNNDFMKNLNSQINQSYTFNSKILDWEGNATSAIVNEKTNQVYITDFYAGKLHILDGNTDELIESIKVVKTPFGVGVNPSTNRIYVGGEYANILSVINANTKEVELDIPLKDPYDIAINPTNNMIYVTSDRLDSVYVIDGITHEIVESLEVMVPCGIAVNSSTGMVYVTSESEDLVRVFDGDTNKLVAEISVEDSPRGVTVNPITNMIYVTNQETNTVSVIDGYENKVVKSIPVGEIPRRIVVNPESNIVFVTNQGSSDVSVIDGNENEVIETIKVSEPFEMAINFHTNKVYTMYYGGKLSTITQNKNTLQVFNSPLKQTAGGIDASSIICKINFELVFKSSDNSPACVKPATLEKLIQRGWAKE